MVEYVRLVSNPVQARPAVQAGARPGSQWDTARSLSSSGTLSGSFGGAVPPIRSLNKKWEENDL